MVRQSQPTGDEACAGVTTLCRRVMGTDYATLRAAEQARWKTELARPQACVRFDKRVSPEGMSTFGAPGFGAPSWVTDDGAPTLPESLTHDASGAGALVLEPDGRVWLCEPAGAFGGHQFAIPKGYREGQTVEWTAKREVYEEAGLNIRLDASLGIFDRDARGRKRTWFFMASRVGGDPAYAHWETHAMVLAPIPLALQLLSNPWDRAVVHAALYGEHERLRRLPQEISRLEQVKGYIPSSGDSQTLVVFDVDKTLLATRPEGLFSSHFFGIAATDPQLAEASSWSKDPAFVARFSNDPTEATLAQTMDEICGMPRVSCCAFTARDASYGPVTAAQLERVGVNLPSLQLQGALPTTLHQEPGKGIFCQSAKNVAKGNLLPDLVRAIVGGNAQNSPVIFVDDKASVVRDAMLATRAAGMRCVGLIYAPKVKTHIVDEARSRDLLLRQMASARSGDEIPVELTF